MNQIGGSKRYWLLLIVAAGFACATLWAQDGNEPLRSRVYALHHITAAQGKAYLERLNFGTTVSQIQQSNALIVTAPPADLVKISSFIGIVDSKQVFVIDRIGPADMAVPKLSAITETLDGVSMGTFMDPPSYTKKSPAILDVQDGSTVLVSPEGMSDTIIKAIHQLRLAPKPKIEAEEAHSVKAAESVVAPKEILAPVSAALGVSEVNAVAATANETNDEEMLNKVVKQLLSDQNQPVAQVNEPAKIVALEPEAATPPVMPEKILPVVEAAPQEKNTVSEEPMIEIETAAKEKTTAMAEPMVIPNGQRELTLSLPETVDVIALLDLVRQYLNINYLYDPAKINGTVTLKIRDNRIKVSELYALTESVLKFKGFAMSRRGNLVTIVPIAEAIGNDPAIRAGGEQAQPGDVVVTTVYNLKYMNVQSALTLLTNMKLGASLNPVTETNTLIVTDYAYRMDRIDKLIAMVDQPGAPKQFKFRQLKYTLASTLVPKIQSIAQQIGTETINIQTGQPSMPGRSGTRAAPRPQPVGPGAAPSSNQPTIFLDSDERTNRLLMVGQEKELVLINELIDTFDVPQQDLRSIKEYEIQFVDAMEVVDTLSTLGIATATSGRSTSQMRGSRIPSPQIPPPPGAAGGAGTTGESPIEEPQIAVLESTNSLLVNATPEQHARLVMVIAFVDRQPSEVAIPYVVYPLEFQKPSELKTSLSELIEKSLKDDKGKVTSTVSRGEDIAIVADDKAFSLIVYASRKNQEWVGSLIRQLDKKRPQVLIDVTLVEIRRTDAFEYDLQMIGAFPNYKTPNQQINNAEIVAPPGANLKEWQTNNTVGGQFFYSDSHIQALLTAIQKKDYGRVLAKPKILVNDNEDGKISTTDTTYIAESTTQIPDQGGPITTTVFKDYNAQIELSIKPHISEGDLLLLEVKMNREDFLPTTVEGSPPNKTASNVDSKVLVPDGKTIILGGLIKLNQSKGGTKVPILGDIPLVGALFRSVKNSDTESKLYIFVKAYALRPTEGVRGLPEAEAVSRVSRDAFEKGEAIFQKYNDIPGITPKPMDPVKVLEEE